MFFQKKKLQPFVRGSWLKIDPREHDIFVQLSGNLNQTLHKEIREVLWPLLKRPIQGAIVLQLSNVHFLDSTIAATVASFFDQAEKRNIPVEIWDASPIVRQVFVGLGFEKLLSRS